MKAAVYTKYGPPDVVRIENIETPVPKDNEVLIRVRAASVNPLDWHFMRGEPYFLRLMTGLAKPKVTRLGVDAAGRVEAAGAKVTKFKPGDEVFGACRGAFAEYACASESAVAAKPANVKYEQAASVPIAGVTALQGLRDKGGIRPGQKVLINAASGGVGTFAVQLAKALGTHVTAVCSTQNLDLVRSIGADAAIDYTREDFTEGAKRYDLILDSFANRSPAEYRRVLNPNGRHVSVGGPTGRWMLGILPETIKAQVLSRIGSRKFLGLFARMNSDDLAMIAALMDAGKVTPVIGRRYKLAKISDAIQYVEAGHTRGKVVITPT